MHRSALADRSNLVNDVCCEQTTVDDSQQKHRVGRHRVGRERYLVASSRVHNDPAPASRSHRRCRALSWQDLLLLFQSSRTPTSRSDSHALLGACVNLSERCGGIEEASLGDLSCFASSSMIMNHHTKVFDSRRYVERCPTDSYLGRKRLVSSSRADTTIKRVQQEYRNVRDDDLEVRDRLCDLRTWLLANSLENEPIADFSLGEGK